MVTASGHGGMARFPEVDEMSCRGAAAAQGPSLGHSTLEQANGETPVARVSQAGWGTSSHRRGRYFSAESSAVVVLGS